MTASMSELLNVRKAPENFTIKFPTGAITLITHIGDITLDNGLRMLNVLHVPGFNHNLFSIHKLAKDNDCDVTFHPEACVVIDSKSRKVRAIGKMVNGLYYLMKAGENQVDNMAKCLLATNSNSRQEREGSESNNYSIWLHRLGHTPGAKLQLIPKLRDQLKDQKLICVTCPTAKLTKLPFEKSESRAATKFELVHIDTWGPYKVCTREKYRYFLTLVDDFSRVTWVYLLQTKSEYLTTMISFYNYVKCHFNVGIKCVRSDNALDFADKSCREFYTKYGIQHQTSCAYRPQQNARVERKHRKILEVARALKFQAGLPISY